MAHQSQSDMLYRIHLYLRVSNEARETVLDESCEYAGGSVRREQSESLDSIDWLLRSCPCASKLILGKGLNCEDCDISRLSLVVPTIISTFPFISTGCSATFTAY